MKIFLSRFIVPTTFMLALYSSPALAESKTVAGAKEDYQIFKVEVANSLDKIDRDLHVLKEKAQDKGSEVKKKTLEEAKIARAKIDAQLSELKDKSKANWSKGKKEVSSSIDSLSKKIQAALE